MITLRQFVENRNQQKKYAEELKDYPKWVQYLGYLLNAYKTGNYFDIHLNDIHVDRKYVKNISLAYVFGEGDKEISKLVQAEDSNAKMAFIVRNNETGKSETIAEVEIPVMTDVEDALKKNTPSDKHIKSIV